MPTSPPFSPPLKRAERNPQKGATDDVGAEDQHPDQQSRFHVSGPAGGARSPAAPNTRDWLNVRAWLSPPTGLSQSNPGRFKLDAGSVSWPYSRVPSPRCRKSRPSNELSGQNM
jgi:hypothetical protein